MSTARTRAASPGAKAKAGSKSEAPKPNGAAEPSGRGPWLTVISEDGLDNIANHKYVPGVYTPLDLFLNPWWFWLTERFPKTLAPNVITFTGTFALAITYLIGWWLSPDFSVPIPSWFAYLSAFAIFVYQTLDACDGKQARRIGLQTPMGQLFDHGCDILACFSHHSMGALIIAPGQALASGNLFAMSALYSGLCMAQFEEYYTHVMPTSVCGWGVTEMQYSLMLANVVAGIAGPEATQGVLRSEVSTPWGQTSVASLVIAGWGMNCWGLSTISFIKTVKYLRKQGPPDAWHRNVLLAMRDLVPIFGMNVLALLWSRSMQLVSIRMITQLSGLIFVLYGWQVVIFGMAKMPLIWFPPTMALYAVVVGLSQLAGSATSMSIIMTAFSALGVLGYMIVWVFSVTDQLTNKLNIHVFTVGSLVDKKA